MTTQKYEPWQVGDTGWEVQWCRLLAIHPDGGGIDHPRCKMVRHAFRRRDDALSHARAMLSRSVGLDVTVTPFEVRRAATGGPIAVSYRAHTGAAEVVAAAPQGEARPEVPSEGSPACSSAT